MSCLHGFRSRFTLWTNLIKLTADKYPALNWPNLSIFTRIKLSFNLREIGNKIKLRCEPIGPECAVVYAQQNRYGFICEHMRAHANIRSLTRKCGWLSKAKAFRHMGRIYGNGECYAKGTGTISKGITKLFWQTIFCIHLLVMAQFTAFYWSKLFRFKLHHIQHHPSLFRRYWMLMNIWKLFSRSNIQTHLRSTANQTSRLPAIGNVEWSTNFFGLLHCKLR